MKTKIRRALISVSDKTDLEKIISVLREYSVEIVSTGGTAKFVKSLDANVVDISQYTGFPEIMDGRVKTLHPKVHGGLLACLDEPVHKQHMQDNNIESIDLVIVNLYPFEQTVSKGAPFSEVIENIDIGGPSMVRSAAKNYNFTTIVTDPADYEALIEQMRANDGATDVDFRKNLAAKAFAKTASYDAAISSWFAEQIGEEFPQTINISAHLKQNLRYGENPHQQAAFYSFANTGAISSAKQIHGKELSYNNINDANAAYNIVSEFKQPAAVIIKHANPCGAAIAQNINDAYLKALASDPVSAFGGIIAFNREIEEGLASELSKMFVEAIIAPAISDSAKEILTAKKNLRILLAPELSDCPGQDKTYLLSSVGGGILVQEPDRDFVQKQDVQFVTNVKPDDSQLEDLLFSLKICKHVKSNAIVLAKDGATIGIGAGQMSRLDSSRMAVLKASDSKEDPDRAKGSVLASDAFFPFADGVEEAAKNGVSAIIQPGGSIRDEEVIAMANKHNIAMVFTGKRHFKH